MDFYLAVVAGQFRRAVEDLGRRHAGTPRTLASLRAAIAAAYRGMRDAWQTGIPAELLPGFLREPAGGGGRDTWT